MATSEAETLSRLVANYIYLSQFELARAALRDLHRLEPESAQEILRTIISSDGDLPGVIYSESVPSAAHQVWLCLGEYISLGGQAEPALIDTAEYNLLLAVLLNKLNVKAHSGVLQESVTQGDDGRAVDVAHGRVTGAGSEGVQEERGGEAVGAPQHTQPEDEGSPANQRHTTEPQLAADSTSHSQDVSTIEGVNESEAGQPNNSGQTEAAALVRLVETLSDRRAWGLQGLQPPQPLPAAAAPGAPAAAAATHLPDHSSHRENAPRLENETSAPSRGGWATLENEPVLVAALQRAVRARPELFHAICENVSRQLARSPPPSGAAHNAPPPLLQIELPADSQSPSPRDPLGDLPAVTRPEQDKLREASSQGAGQVAPPKLLAYPESPSAVGGAWRAPADEHSQHLSYRRHLSASSAPTTSSSTSASCSSMRATSSRSSTGASTSTNAQQRQRSLAAPPLLRAIQAAHVDEALALVRAGRAAEACESLRFLNEEFCGNDDSMYRPLLKELALAAAAAPHHGREGAQALRVKAHQGVLASGRARLLQLQEEVEDERVREEAEEAVASTFASSFSPSLSPEPEGRRGAAPPLERLHATLQRLRGATAVTAPATPTDVHAESHALGRESVQAHAPDQTALGPGEDQGERGNEKEGEGEAEGDDEIDTEAEGETEVEAEAAIERCKREMFHYARITRRHALACAIDDSLTAVAERNFQKAADVLAIAPKLRPLVAAMGWDHFPGDTSARQLLLAHLWHAPQLDSAGAPDPEAPAMAAVPGEHDWSSNPPAQEMSSIEHLCKQLAYRLEVALFAAQASITPPGAAEHPRRGHESESASAQQARQSAGQGGQEFVAKLALERLAIQSPIRVLFDVLPEVRPEDALALVSRQPLGSERDAAARRQWDMELLHMHYAVEASVHALAAMEEASGGEQGFLPKEEGLRLPAGASAALRDLEHHFAALTTPPRKLWLVGMMVDILCLDACWARPASPPGGKPAAGRNGQSSSPAFDSSKTPAGSQEIPSGVYDGRKTHGETAGGAGHAGGAGNQAGSAAHERLPAKGPVVDFLSRFLRILRENLLEPGCEVAASQPPAGTGREDADVSSEESHQSVHERRDTLDGSGKRRKRAAGRDGDERGRGREGGLSEATREGGAGGGGRSSSREGGGSLQAEGDARGRAWRRRGEQLRAFLRDASWRLEVLERLTPGGEGGRQGPCSWEEALRTLRAAPSALLNMCMRAGQLALAEEAVQYFHVPADEVASLQLARWLLQSASEASKASSKTSSPEDLDFPSLPPNVPPLNLALLCMDVAATSASRPPAAERLLHRAQALLQEAERGQGDDGKGQEEPRRRRVQLQQDEEDMAAAAGSVPGAEAGEGGHTQEAEKALLAVAKRAVQRLLLLLSQNPGQPLPSLLASTSDAATGGEAGRPGPKQRAMQVLHQTIEGCYQEVVQFLSGNLHNLVKALADDDDADPPPYPRSPRHLAGREPIDLSHGLLGIGLPALPKPPPSSSSSAAVTAGVRSGTAAAVGGADGPAVVPGTSAVTTLPPQPLAASAAGAGAAGAAATGAARATATGAGKGAREGVGATAGVAAATAAPTPPPEARAVPGPARGAAGTAASSSSGSASSPNRPAFAGATAAPAAAATAAAAGRAGAAGPLPPAPAAAAGAAPTLVPATALGIQLPAARPRGYLPALIYYVATVGALVDEAEPSHLFNYFSILYEHPQDLLTRMVFEKGDADAAAKVAAIMGTDLVHQVISACVPPVYPPRALRGWARVPSLIGSEPPRGSGGAGSTPQGQARQAREDQVQTLHPLKLEVVKQLAQSSPVRATLAAVFSSSHFLTAAAGGAGLALPPALAGGGVAEAGGRAGQSSAAAEGGGEEEEEEAAKGAARGEEIRKLHEFAVEQSAKYPALHRWIQLQTNICKLANTTASSRRPSGSASEPPPPVGHRVRSLKRRHPEDGDESGEGDRKRQVARPGADADANAATVGELLGEGGPAESRADAGAEAEAEAEAAGGRGGKRMGRLDSLLFHWESPQPALHNVESLMEEGRVMEALELADKWLPTGAPDKLLCHVIEDAARSTRPAARSAGQSNAASASWRHCIRLQDKELAAKLALRHMQRWELEPALDVLLMCLCHLASSSPLYREVSVRREQLQRFAAILEADPQLQPWQEVEAFCERDAEGLALRLAAKGAVASAVQVAEAYELRPELQQELHGRQVSLLLVGDPTKGAGAAAGLKYLERARASDALPIAMAAIEQLESLHSKQLLVRFLLKRRGEVLSEEQRRALGELARGLQVLQRLARPWQQRCAALAAHPRLIFETLLMWKQIPAASQLLQEFSFLRDDALVLTYAAKALDPEPADYRRQVAFQQLPSPPPVRSKSLTGGPEAGRSRSPLKGSPSLAAGLSRVFPSWGGARDGVGRGGGAAKESNSAPPARAGASKLPLLLPWEAMAGSGEEPGTSGQAGGERGWGEREVESERARDGERGRAKGRRGGGERGSEKGALGKELGEGGSERPRRTKAQSERVGGGPPELNTLLEQRTAVPGGGDAMAERVAATAVAMSEWVLTGDPAKDAAVRRSHSFPAIPSAALFKALVGLCLDEATAVTSTISICVGHVRNVLSAERLPGGAPTVAVEQALYAAGEYVEALQHARGLLARHLSEGATRGGAAGGSFKDEEASARSPPDDDQTDDGEGSTAGGPGWGVGIAGAGGPSNRSFRGAGVTGERGGIGDYLGSTSSRMGGGAGDYLTSAGTSPVPSSAIASLQASPVAPPGAYLGSGGPGGGMGSRAASEQSLLRSTSSEVRGGGESLGLAAESEARQREAYLGELHAETEAWLARVELLQGLLGAGVAASIGDLEAEGSAVQLRDRLVEAERYTLARQVCAKLKLDSVPVWTAWGQALLLLGKYGSARNKFRQAMLEHRGDPMDIVSLVVATLESVVPVDVAAAQALYEETEKTVKYSAQEALSTESYLSALNVPAGMRTTPQRKAGADAEGAEGAYARVSVGSADEDGPRTSHLDSVRYEECLFYLNKYARREMLPFMFRHGRYRDACLLLFPPDAVPPPPGPSSFATQAASSSPQRPDPLATDHGTIDELCALCVTHDAVRVLERAITARGGGAASARARAPRGGGAAALDPVAQHTAAALVRICAHFEAHRHFHHLHTFQMLQKEHVAAGLTCIQLFINEPSHEEALRHLERAKDHFDEGQAARQLSGEGARTRLARGKNAAAKLSEEELLKLRVVSALQIDVLQAVGDPHDMPWKVSLFGNPNEPETLKRRCEVAEKLAEKNFGFAFRMIVELNLPAAHVYAGVAASLAERRRSNQLWEVIRNIKGTLDDNDWDQVLGVAIRVYAQKHRERPDKLIDQLSSNHRRVLAYVACGRLKTAFQLASSTNAVADVIFVQHEAKDSVAVKEMCRQWLAERNVYIRQLSGKAKAAPDARA